MTVAAQQQDSGNNNNNNVWAEVLASAGVNGTSAAATLKTAGGPQTKNILVLGESQSGKKTLLHHLNVSAITATISAAAISTSTASTNVQSNLNAEESTIGLSYEYVDLRDDEDETVVLGRLGFYILNYSVGLNPSILQHCKPDLVVLTLDWSQPWQFLASLHRWLSFIEQSPLCRREQSSPSALIDRQEKLRRYLQGFTAADSASNPSTMITLGPVSLPEGCLLHNLGLPVVVVCTKADQLHRLEQEVGFKEPDIDFIQQSLRVACLQYGAALFYTTKFRPETFSNLRLYLAHRLLGWIDQPPLQQQQTNQDSNSEQQQQKQQQQQHKPSNSWLPAVFPLAAQVVEKDTVMVPAGWDSWGKIKVLRESFDCTALDLASNKYLQSYNSALPPPPLSAAVRSPLESPDNMGEVQLEDEQTFLARQSTLLAESVEEAKTDDVGVRLKRLSKLKDSSNATPLSTPQKPRLESVAASPMTSNEPGQNQVLANFFQSLLNKKGGGGDGASRSAVAAELNKLKD